MQIVYDRSIKDQIQIIGKLLGFFNLLFYLYLYILKFNYNLLIHYLYLF